MSRRIHIDPGDDPVPGLGIKLHAVVALCQQADQVRLVGVIVTRRQHVRVTLDRGVADVLLKRDVGGREMGAFYIGILRRLRMNIRPECQVSNRLAITPSPFRPGVVAANAEPVEHGLNLAIETKPAHGSVPRFDRRRRSAYGRRELLRRRRAGGLVAPDAGEDLSRPTGEPAPHVLQRLAFRIKRLHGQRQHGRNGEMGAAVRLNGNGAENHAGVPWSVEPNAVLLATHAAHGEVITVNPELLNRATRDTGEAVTRVDIAHNDRGILFPFDHTRRDTRRLRCLPQRNRFHHLPSLRGAKQEEVVKHIHEIDAAGCASARYGRNKEVFIRQWVRMQRPRVPSTRKPVEDDRFDRLAMAGNGLDNAVRFVSSTIGIEQHDPSIAGEVVVPPDD